MCSETKMGIYYIRINNKFYVGQSINVKNRLREHEIALTSGYHPNKYLQRAYNKYKDVKYHLITTCRLEELNELEILYITFYDTMIPNGYNLTFGGAGGRGYKHTEESKAKMRESTKGQICSDETRLKLSVINKGQKHYHYGKPLSEETKAKMSAALKGRVISLETRAKISAAGKGKPGPNLGKSPSAETRAKISAANKGEKNGNYGRIFSTETRAKISAANKGKKRSPESKAKIGAASKQAWIKRKEKLNG